MSDFSPGTALAEVARGLTASLAVFVPRLLTAVVILLVGLLVAAIIRRLIRSAFARLRLDDLLEKVGVTELLGRVGLTGRPGELLARLVYYLLVLLFLQTAAQAVALVAVSSAIGALFAYLPNLVAAVIVLLVGLLAGRFVGDLVRRAAADAGVDFAPVLGRSVTVLVVFVVAVMAVAQLRIDTALIKSVVLVLLGGMAVALALSFGLGSREATRHLVAGFYVRKLWRVGEIVDVGEWTGTVVGITPLHVLLEREGRVTAVPNGHFLERTSAGKVIPAADPPPPAD